MVTEFTGPLYAYQREKEGVSVDLQPDTPERKDKLFLNVVLIRN